MSLVVFGSASKVAQGLIRQLYTGGKFEKILCADTYSSYWGIQRHTQFLQSLENAKVSTQTKLQEAKVAERSELQAAISSASHLLYVTHDYYENSPSKVNLLKQSAKLAAANKGLKNFVAVTPVELDNYNEERSGVQEEAEKEAKQQYARLVVVRSDLTFGPDATVVNRIVQRLLDHEGISLKNRKGAPAPIFSKDLAEGVEKLLLREGGAPEGGERYYAQGPKHVEWSKILATLERFAGAKAQSGLLDAVLTPSSVNLLTELIHSRDYLNLVQFVANYQAPHESGAKNLFEGVAADKLTDFESYYSSNKLSDSTYAASRRLGLAEKFIVAKLY